MVVYDYATVFEMNQTNQKNGFGMKGNGWSWDFFDPAMEHSWIWKKM
jgi:hypothetical protein